jgi:gamma-glutamylaminecyclotransferase
MTRLFVYGTLKRGCKNHHHLVGQYVGEARTTPGYRLHDLGDYPGMVADATDTDGVTGEIWSVDDAALAHLDDFEGVDEGLYLRERVTLAGGAFADADVHTYLYARSVADRPALGATWIE